MSDACWVIVQPTQPLISGMAAVWFACLISRQSDKLLSPKLWSSFGCRSCCRATGKETGVGAQVMFTHGGQSLTANQSDTLVQVHGTRCEGGNPTLLMSAVSLPCLPTSAMHPSADGVMRTMTTEKLLKGMPILQGQIDALLEFDVSEIAVFYMMTMANGQWPTANDK